MKSTIKFLGIIAIVALIGFSITACDTGTNNNSSNSGGGGSLAVKLLKSTNFGSAVEFTVSGHIDQDDFEITIDGRSVLIGGKESGGNIHKLSFIISPALVIGQSYDVTITYIGSDRSIAAKFPFSGTLTCMKW